MQRFTDNAKRTWAVEINVSTIMRVLKTADFDLRKVLDGDGAALEQLITDPVTLCNVLYAVCKPEADAQSVSDEAFGAGLLGDALDQATSALTSAIVDFCPRPSVRQNLGRVMKAINDAMDKAAAIATARIEAGELDRITEQALRKIEAGDPASGSASSNSPA